MVTMGSFSLDAPHCSEVRLGKSTCTSLAKRVQYICAAAEQGIDLTPVESFS